MTSKEFRLFLSYFGITFHSACQVIPPQKMWSFDQAVEKTMQLMPPVKMANQVNRLLAATDYRESKDAKARGFINFTTFERGMRDSGLTDEEITLVLMPYRTVD